MLGSPFSIQCRSVSVLSGSVRRISLSVVVMLSFLFGTVRLAAQVPAARHSVIVRLVPGADSKAAIEQISTLLPTDTKMSARAFMSGTSGASVLSGSPLARYMVLDLEVENPESFRTSVRNLPTVEDAFPNHVWTINREVPNDEFYPEQWALERIDALDAWDVTEGSSDVLVGIIDTGIEWDHPDLIGALWINPAEDINGNGSFEPWPSDEMRDGVSGDLDGIDQDGNGFRDDVIGYDFVDQEVPNIGDWNGWDPVPGDDQGHGTTVAGVIGARRNNRIGTAGIAPGVRLVTLRAFDGTGNGQDDDVAAAIVYAADIGVDVLNMSFGDFYLSPLMHDAISYAAAKGVVLVASSGNDGVSDPHYPSGFTEVMSIGATTEGDLLSPFSTFGSQLSMVAPGVDIYTTSLGGEYSAVSGTSFASPYVAGVAALLRSVHPEWTAEEIVAALELSSEDLGERGWDPNFGAGRLNAGAALKGSGPAAIHISAPHNDEGVDRDTEVQILGSAVAPLLESWSLDVGLGNLPQSWDQLARSDIGVLDGKLGTLDTREYPDTLLMLRLRLQLTNGRTIERRVRFFLDRTPPDTVEFALRNAWRFDRRALALTLRTDDPARTTIWVRPSGQTIEPYRPFELESEFVGLTRTHFFFLTHLELIPGAPYDLYVEMINAAGGRNTVGSPDEPIPVSIEQAGFPVSGMRLMEWTLPYGFVLNSRVKLTGSDSSEILMNRFRDLSFEQLSLYRFDDGEFVLVDTAANWIPRDVGDSDGDGLLEVLGQSSQEGIVYEQTEAGGSPFASVMYLDSASKRFFPSTFYDFDGDGRDELVGYTSENDFEDQYHYVASWNGQAYEEQVRIPNVTRPRAGFSRNFLGASDVVIGDFNRNGKVDMLFGDGDSDFMLYERESADSWKVLWVDENDGNEGDRMVAAGDIDNDGIDELVVAYAVSPLELDNDKEHRPGLWTLKVVKPGSGGVQVLAEEEFVYVRPTSPFRAGLEVGDLDGQPGAEIALSVFPNMYVLRWDEINGRLAPFWWRSASLINRPLIQDFNGDGIAELGVGDGAEILFYQIDPDRNTIGPPAGAYGWSLNDSTAYLEWEPVAGADRYVVYRDRIDSDDTVLFEQVGVVQDVFLVDSGQGTPEGRLENGGLYDYVVTAVDDDHPEVQSSPSAFVRIYVHPQATLVGAVATGGSEIRLEFSQPVRETLYRNAAVQIEHAGEDVPVSSVQPVGEFAVLVSLLEERYGQELAVRPTVYFRDRYDAPADTASSINVVMPEKVEERSFAAVHAAPESAGKRVGIDFNADVDPVSGLDPANYSIDPPGTVIDVQADPDNSRRIIITLNDEYPLGPFGYEYLVTVRNVSSVDGQPISTGAGSVVGFTISATELDDLFVYPHPFSVERDGLVTFAGLPQGVLIRIYTASGSILRELESTLGDGGLTWDGTDAAGRVVPGGIYLYSVVLVTPEGEERESRLRKIAVLP